MHTTSKKQGFTIVESLVAITILVLAVTGATSGIQTGISSYIFSKDQIIAFYLAQEGFEQIRNIRDENGLNGLDWLNDISSDSNDPCYFGNTCIVSPVESTTPTRCSGGAGSCPVLRQDVDNGFFGYNSLWPTTMFRREITLSQINANEVSITVTVDWSKGITNRQFKARANILNWQ